MQHRCYLVCSSCNLVMLILHVLIGDIEYHLMSGEGKKKSKSDGSDSSEENLSKKELALQQALEQITSSFGKGSIMWLGRSVGPKQVPVVSTGSFTLDIALGIGGFPKVCFIYWNLYDYLFFLLQICITTISMEFWIMQLYFNLSLLRSCVQYIIWTQVWQSLLFIFFTRHILFYILLHHQLIAYFIQLLAQLVNMHTLN